jgi:hypothetical protein
VVFDPDYWTNPNFTQLESEAYESGARINNNSWGYSDSGGDYGIASQEFDALVRDAQPAGSAFPAPGNQEMVIVFAAGDSGPGSETVLEPGTAKNVITVGGADNVQPFGGSDECGIGDDEADSANEIALLLLARPVRGRTPQARPRRAFHARQRRRGSGANPGALGTADACYNGDSVCGGIYNNNFYPPGQQFYTASDGTSQSAPCVAGGCALVRQYFVNNSGSSRPRPP